MTASHNDRARGAISHMPSVELDAGLSAHGPVGGIEPNGAGDDVVTITYPYNGGVPTSVDGGAGTDTLIVAWGSDNNSVSLVTNAGSPPNNGYDGTLTDNLASSTVAFTSFEKFNVTTGSGNDSLQTGGGNDTVNSGLGTDTVSMGAGSDLLVVDYSSNNNPQVVTGFTDNGANGYSGTIGDNYGNPPKVTFDGVETFQLTTGAGNDSIALGNAVSTINTGAGDDSINSGTAVDHLDAGAGNDRWSADLSAQSTAVLLDLQAGTYSGPGTAAGFEGLGTFSSGSGADNIKLGTLNYNETVSTNGGNDTVSAAGYGLDTVHMGAGTDTLMVDLSTDGQQITMSAPPRTPAAFPVRLAISTAGIPSLLTASMR